jgi:hypothetical protein
MVEARGGNIPMVISGSANRARGVATTNGRAVHDHEHRLRCVHHGDTCGMKRVQHQKCARARVLAHIHARAKHLADRVQNDQLDRGVSRDQRNAIRQFAEHLLVQ